MTNWADTARFTLTAGRAPAGRGEVAVSVAAARTAGVRVGDTVTLLLDESRHQARVVGLYDYRPLGREAAPALAFQTTAAQRLLGLPGRVSAVDLVAAPGVAASELVSRAQAAVPDARVVDGQAENADAQERPTDELRTLLDALLGLAGVALLVGRWSSPTPSRCWWGSEPASWPCSARSACPGGRCAAWCSLRPSRSGSSAGWPAPPSATGSRPGPCDSWTSGPAGCRRC
jgi:hypothetical protein